MSERNDTRSASSSTRGLGVDEHGGPVFDPSKNVLDLVEAAIKRQDDLRAANEKYLEAESRHLHEMAELRAQYDQLIRENDIVRQEKVREVDVLNGRTEAERAQTAIKALAEASALTAETLRKTAETVSASQSARISALELAVSAGAGKGAGMEKMWGWVAAGITLILSLLGTFGIVISMRGKS